MRQLEREKKKGKERKEGEGEGNFIGEKLATLACPAGVYAYCCLQVWAFSTRLLKEKKVDTEVMIGDEGFKHGSGVAQVKIWTLY